MNEYPKYVSHKEVRAVQIAAVEKRSDGGLTVHPDGGYPSLMMTVEQLRAKPTPEAGWYAIRYADGYLSFSPAKSFEGYQLIATEPEPPSYNGGLTVHPDGGYPSLMMTVEQLRAKPTPEAGWYAIRYADGYLSFSPAKSFEEGYELIATEPEPPSYTEFTDTGFAGADDPYGIGEYTAQSAAK